jgi:putative tryptophan/tyrosine transport system substrate-binding protein
VRRRTFIATAGSAALTLPASLRAQQKPIPVIGVLSGRSASESANLLVAFRRGLTDEGLAEGRDLAIEFRWANGEFDRLPDLAAELVRLRPAAVVTVGAAQVTPIVKVIMESGTPVLFSTGGDPVRLGLVASLNRPGGNATGVVNFLFQLEGKRLALLHELVPHALKVAALLNGNGADVEKQRADVMAAARELNLTVELFSGTNAAEIDRAYEAIGALAPGAVLVCADPLFYQHHARVVALAARHALPAMYELREFVEAGGLISYGTSLADGYRQLGITTAKVLKGAKPAELPVVQMTKFETVINLKTAKALGLSIAPTLLARADAVIE